jgi:hypothetical protein
MNTPKVVRWLRSRPLARVRRNLATERQIRASCGGSTCRDTRLLRTAPQRAVGEVAMRDDTGEVVIGIILFLAFCAFLYWANGGG